MLSDRVKNNQTLSLKINTPLSQIIGLLDSLSKEIKKPCADFKVLFNYFYKFILYLMALL